MKRKVSRKFPSHQHIPVCETPELPESSKKNMKASRHSEHGPVSLKENLNASRPSEHPPIRGENVKTFR